MIKNKVAAPFRKAEFDIFYDGRPMDKVNELASVALANGLIPKYDRNGNISETGRTYKWPSDPTFIATSKGEVPAALRKCPKMQEELLNIIKNGLDDPDVHTYDSQDSDADLSEEEFEEKIRREAKELENSNEAEETSGGWEEI